MHKTSTRSNLTKPQHEWGDGHKVQPWAVKLMATDGGGRESYLRDVSPLKATHAPLHGLTVMHVQAALSGHSGFAKRTPEIGRESQVEGKKGR